MRFSPQHHKLTSSQAVLLDLIHQHSDSVQVGFPWWNIWTCGPSPNLCHFIFSCSFYSLVFESPSPSDDGESSKLELLLALRVAPLRRRFVCRSVCACKELKALINTPADIISRSSPPHGSSRIHKTARVIRWMNLLTICSSLPHLLSFASV